MKEFTSYPETVISSGDFIATVIESQGDLATVQQTFPGVVRRFSDEWTRAEDVPPNVDVIPYYAQFGEDGKSFEAGDTIRARGSFSVWEKEGKAILSFRAGIRGDRFFLGEIDEQTAAAFAAYGPTFTEVDMLLSDSRRICGCHSNHQGTLKAVVGIQELFSGNDSTLELNELALVDGEVIGYRNPNPDMRPVLGRAALLNQLDKPEYSDERPSLIIMQDNGNLVTMQGAYSDEIRYEDTPLARIDDTPQIGDKVRVLAQLAQPEHYVYGQGYVPLDKRLHPRAIQIMEPSVARAETADKWQHDLESKIQALGEKGSSSAPGELAELLESAVYVEGGHRTKLGLTLEQRQRAAAKVEAVFAGSEDAMPLIVPYLKDPKAADRLFEAIYAAGEGAPAFSMTKDELKQFVFRAITTMGKYNPDVRDDISYIARLFQDIFPGNAGTEVARAAWEHIKDDTNVPEGAMERRIRTLQEITYRSTTSAMASVWRDIALSDKTSNGEICDYIANALDSLGHDKINVTPDILEAYAIYEDAIDQLAYKINRMDDSRERSLAEYHLDKAFKARTAARLHLPKKA